MQNVIAFARKCKPPSKTTELLASPVRQIVDAANIRCELACIERDDFRAPLAFTVWDNQTGDVSKRYELGPDGKIKPAKSKAVLYEAMAYRAECLDLTGLSELLDVLPPNAALSNGVFDEPIARVTTLGRTKAGGEKVSRSRAHMRWRAGPGAVALDGDIQAGHEEIEVDGLLVPLAPRSMDALLCKIVPWWAGIDRLYRYSPSSGIADLKGNILKPLKNFRIFIAVDDMTKTEALGAEVHAALHEAGHGWIELAANGNMLDRTLIDPCMYRPEHLIYVNPSLGAGLKRIEMESLLIRGEHDRLETAGKGLSGTIAEWRRSSPAYKALVEAKRPEQRAFVERLKEQARAEARAKGEPEEAAAVRVGQVANHWLPPEFELCLEDGERVTCRELQEHPDKYDGKRCYDPSDWTYRDEDPRIGLIYLKNGLAQIYTHAHGGIHYFLQPLPMPASAFDEFPPRTDEAFRIGRRGDELPPRTDEAFRIGRRGEEDPEKALYRSLRADDGAAWLKPGAVAVLAKMKRSLKIGGPARYAKKLADAKAANPDFPKDDIEAAVAAEEGRVKKGKPAAVSPLAKIQTVGLLMRQSFPEPKYVCEGLLPEGLSLLAGRPKAGKSMLALDLAWGVATGGSTLGRQCEKGSVLLLALEDHGRRLQARFRKLAQSVAGWDVPLEIAFEWPKGQAGADWLCRWCEQAQKTGTPRLVIGDTLAKLKDVPKGGKGDTYASDYEATAVFHDFSKRTGVPMLFIHHTRKSDAEDAFDTISGTLGNTAAFDTLMVLKREQSGMMGLHGRGRDMAEYKHAVAFDGETLRWTMSDADFDDLDRSVTEQRVLAALGTAGESFSAVQVHRQTGIDYETVRKTLQRAAARGDVIKPARGEYSAKGAAAAPEEFGDGV